MPVPSLSPIEEYAREVIARLLGVRVVQHDDQSAAGLPDLRIEYPDRPHAVVEVVRDVDRVRPEQRDALHSRGWSIDDPSLTRSWAIEPEPAADMRQLRKDLPLILKSAERAGRGQVQPLPWSQLDPIAYELYRLRVVRAHSFPRSAGAPAVWFAPGRAYFWDGDLTKEKPGFWTRRRAFEQVRHGSNIQLLSYSLVTSSRPGARQCWRRTTTLRRSWKGHPSPSVTPSWWRPPTAT
jgi:hypothetical protein